MAVDKKPAQAKTKTSKPAAKQAPDGGSKSGLRKAAGKASLEMDAKDRSHKKVATKKLGQGIEAKANGVYFAEIGGEEIYKNLNKPLRSSADHFVLNASVIQQKLDDAISEAKVINAHAAKLLKLKLSKRELKPYNDVSSKNKNKLSEAFADPLNRRMVEAFEASKDAFSSLLTTKDMANRLAGDMRKSDLFRLIDSFINLGVARYCVNDVYSRGDFAEYAAMMSRGGTEDATKERLRKAKLVKEKIESLAKLWIAKYPSKPATDIHGLLKSELLIFAKSNGITRGLSDREVTNKIRRVKNQSA